MSHSITSLPSHQPPVRPVRPMRPAPSTRVGDAERDAACAQLAAHYSAGRLSPAEMDERASAAVAAITNADLLALLDDLPPLGSVLPVGTAAAPAPQTHTGRQVVMALWGALTVMAAVCTGLLLLAMFASGVEAITTFLGVLGGAVAASGITFFVTRGGPSPRPMAADSIPAWAPARHSAHAPYWASTRE